MYEEPLAIHSLKFDVPDLTVEERSEVEVYIPMGKGCICRSGRIGDGGRRG